AASGPASLRKRNCAPRRCSAPAFRSRGLTDTRVQDVSRIKALVEFRQGRLCLVEMPDVMFRRVLGSTLLEKMQHSMLESDRIHAFAEDVVLMEDMAEEVAIIELVNDIQRDVQRQDVLHLFAVHFAVTDSSARRSKPVQERLGPFIRRAFEEVAGARGKSCRQI